MYVNTFEQDGNMMVELEGRLDSAGLRVVESSLMYILEKHTGPVLVDMASVDYMSSAGIRLLAHFVMLSEELNRDFRLFNLTPNVERVINVVRMKDFFQPLPNYQAAVASL